MIKKRRWLGAAHASTLDAARGSIPAPFKPSPRRKVPRQSLERRCSARPMAYSTCLRSSVEECVFSGLRETPVPQQGSIETVLGFVNRPHWTQTFPWALWPHTPVASRSHAAGKSVRPETLIARPASFISADESELGSSLSHSESSKLPSNRREMTENLPLVDLKRRSQADSDLRL